MTGSMPECVESWVRASVEFSHAREIHVEIHGTSGFAVRETGGLGLSKRLMSSVGTARGDCRIPVLERISSCAGIMRVESREQGSFTTVSAVYDRGCRLVDVKSSMNGRQGTRLVVKDWHSETGGQTSSRARMVYDCRWRIENIALISQHVTFTVYCKQSKRFVYKSVRGKPFDVKAAEFFGHVDPELVVPLGGHGHGWVFSGYAVLPPVGYATRGRQRLYVHSMLVENAEVQDRIDALYMQVYQDNVKLLPPRGEVLRVKKSLHAHAMYVLCIQAENMDARRTGQMPVWDEIMESVEACFLHAWRQSLSGRLIHVLESFANGAPLAKEKKPNEQQRMMNSVKRQHDSGNDMGLELDQYRYRGGIHRGLCHDVNQSVTTNDVSTPVMDDHSHGSRNYLSQLPKRRRSSSQNKHVVDELISGWKNPVLIPHTDPHSSFSLPVSTVAHQEERSFRRLRQDQLQRKDIIDCTIIGQIDRKFIAFKSASGNLGLVDQHAADERVRLEVLQSQVFLEDGHPNPEFVQSWKCPENLHVYVGQDEVELFDLYKTHANAWGWRWEPWCPSTKSILVTHVPLIYHKALSGADLKLYIHQLVETSACRVAPQGCYRVLASIACRGAIMFGDALTMDQARALVHSLSSTMQYYECAHGRPTLTSLIHVPSLVVQSPSKRRGIESIKSNILSSLQNHSNNY
ncbi:hypothetical protein M9435_004220 [Picochlorum sp. BPE23]|nr:hypothetical protein M9435_004220 [Picochlorum sp. BPE23]